MWRWFWSHFLTEHVLPLERLGMRKHFIFFKLGKFWPLYVSSKFCLKDEQPYLYLFLLYLHLMHRQKKTFSIFSAKPWTKFITSLGIFSVFYINAGDTFVKLSTISQHMRACCLLLIQCLLVLSAPTKSPQGPSGLQLLHCLKPVPLVLDLSYGSTFSLPGTDSDPLSTAV